MTSSSSWDRERECIQARNHRIIEQPQPHTNIEMLNYNNYRIYTPQTLPRQESQSCRDRWCAISDCRRLCDGYIDPSRMNEWMHESFRTKVLLVLGRMKKQRLAQHHAFRLKKIPFVVCCRPATDVAKEALGVFLIQEEVGRESIKQDLTKTCELSCMQRNSLVNHQGGYYYSQSNRK